MSSKVERRCAELATFTLSIDFAQDIPDELIEAEILPRLDVKTLHKFKCVSKRYESLISHTKFGLGYTQKAYSSLESMSSSGLRSTMLFPFTDLSPFIKESGGTLSNKIKDLYEEDALLPTISVNSISLPDLMGHLIIDSTNGLVLSRYYDFPLLRDSFNTLWVSNPLTHQSVKLPPNKHVTSINKVYGFASRRDQSTGLLTYKVVVFGFPRKNMVPVSIFSSETGRWVSLEVPQPQRLYCLPFSNGFSHKGCLYFCCWNQRYVLTYNPYDSPDRFDRISLPPESDPCRTSLVHSDSTVRCWELIKCDEGLAVTVWRLGDAMESWTSLGGALNAGFDFLLCRMSATRAWWLCILGTRMSFVLPTWSAQRW